MNSSAYSEIKNGSESFWLKSDRVELYVTREGAHLGPVNFKLKHRWVNPYSVAPWSADSLAGDIAPVIRNLRGDFFCMPFGESSVSEFKHGDPANANWKLLNRSMQAIVLELELPSLKGKITKKLSLNPNERAVYQEHIIEGVRGKYNYGHHAVLEVPKKDSAQISSSHFKYAQVAPKNYMDPAKAEYSCLAGGSIFSSLDSVQMQDLSFTSLHEYPAREGFDDLVMLSAEDGDLAWTAVTMGGYVWLSLRNPESLPSTLLWFSNGGRHAKPWSGEHRRRLGVADVCSYFSEGLSASRKDHLVEQGIATTRSFRRRFPTSIRCVHAVHQVSKGFGRVVKLEKVADKDELVIYGENEDSFTVPVSWRYLFS